MEIKQLRERRHLEMKQKLFDIHKDIKISEAKGKAYEHEELYLKEESNANVVGGLLAANVTTRKPTPKVRYEKERDMNLSSDLLATQKPFSMFQCDRIITDAEGNTRKVVFKHEASEREDRKSEISSLGKAIEHMMKIQSLPSVKLYISDGNPLDYLYFRTTFKEVVEDTLDDQRSKLTRLIHYTSGEAKELIKEFVHERENCYDKAIEMLDKEYGSM